MLQFGSLFVASSLDMSNRAICCCIFRLLGGDFPPANSHCSYHLHTLQRQDLTLTLLAFATSVHRSVSL